MLQINDADIQSHVLLGHAGPIQAALFLRFAPNHPPSNAIQGLLPFLTSVKSVLCTRLMAQGSLSFTQEGLLHILPSQPKSTESPHVQNPSISNPPTTSPPRAQSSVASYGSPYGDTTHAFQMGAYHRDAVVGDEEEWKENWKFGKTADSVHAVLILSRPTADAMQSALAEVENLPGWVVAYIERGHSHPNSPLEFKDDIQRVQIYASLKSGYALPSWPLTHPVLPEKLFASIPGMSPPRDEYGTRKQPWAEFGSFLVLRRYQLHAGAFATIAEKLHPNYRSVHGQARIFGRWQNGTTLVHHPGKPGMGSPKDLNSNRDSGGADCPLSAHARVMRDTNRAPYPIFRRSFRSDDEDAMLFASFQASIGHQFEGLMRRATRPLEEEEDHLPDALLGGHSELSGAQHRRFVEEPKNIEHDLPAAAVCEGMVYALTPTLSTISCWAKGVTVKPKEPVQENLR